MAGKAFEQAEILAVINEGRQPAAVAEQAAVAPAAVENMADMIQQIY